MNTAETLTRAADRLEELASKALPGPWTAQDGVKEGFTDGWHLSGEGMWLGVEATLEAEAEAEWITTMSPNVAAPLVAWLRGASICALVPEEHWGAMTVHAVAFAKQIVKEEK